MNRPTPYAASLIAGTMALSLACAQPAPQSPDQNAQAAPAPGPPSWNDGATKDAIIDFVARVTDPSGWDFVPEAERIATFDNDGTLWSEKPIYFQLYFAIDRVKELASAHPDWEGQARRVPCLEGR